MYPILLDGNSVGKAEVVKEGLYYRFSCVCYPTNKEIYRIFLNDGRKTRNLGVCVPDGRRFILNVCVPVKYISNGDFSFEMKPEETDLKYEPIESGKAFSNLDLLEDAKLQTIDGKQVLIINQSQVLQDSDPIRKYRSESE